MISKKYNSEMNEFPAVSIKGKFKHAWVEDNIEISQSEYREDKHYLGKSVENIRTTYLAATIAIILLIVLIKVFFLQILNGTQYRQLAEKNRIRINPIMAERGVIFDRFGKKLVSNVPNFSLALVPQDLPPENNSENILKRIKTINNLVNISGVEKNIIVDILKDFGNYSFASLVIKDDLEYENALKIYLESQNLPGVKIIKGNKRRYQAEDQNISSSTLSLSHLIGYMGKLDAHEYESLSSKGYLLFDNIGKTGLEKQYEGKLRGSYGRQKVEVDAGGHDSQILAVEPPKPGNNLYLEIDLEAQSKMEEILRKTLEKFKKKRGSAIAINPKTGGIVAMVSWPAFDNNDFSGGIKSKKYQEYLNDENMPLYNRSISGTYPSGSTVKMIMTVAALQEGVINQNTTFLSTGGIAIGQWFFNDWLAGGHGITNARRAIAWSVNTFYYYIGGGYKDFTGLGVDRIVKYLKMFNLSKKTGIDIEGEANGFLPSKEWKLNTKKETWYVGDTYNLSIGQGDLLVTPLQVAVWTSAIANGGYLIQPHLVNSIEDPTTDKKEVLQFSKTNIDINKNHINLAKWGMKDCVDYGSCPMLRDLNFTSGGKTGTAQWNNNNKQNHAWFTSFAPFAYPQIVVTVLIEEGEGGATTAQPVAYEFLKWWGSKYIK